MTDTTATQGLLRTTPADDPKQMATYLRGLAEGVDRRMARHVYDQQRARRRPFACLEVNTEVAYDSNAFPNQVQFDTVAADTAGLADLSVSASVINLRSAGWWAIGAYVHTTGFGAANSDTVLNLQTGGGFFVSNAVRDAAIGLAAVSADMLVRVSVPNSYTTRITITWNGSSTSSITTLRYAQMWAYWVRDL